MIINNIFFNIYYLPRYVEEQMAKDWTSPIYGFFKPHPAVGIVDGRRCHEFICVAPHCKGKGTRPQLVWQYLNKVDRGSTSNRHKHAKTCWGMEIISKVLETKNELTINEVHKSLSNANLQDGTITSLFERKGKGNVSLSMKQHTYMETQSVNI